MEENKNTQETEAIVSEHFALEILRQEQEKSKAKENGLWAMGILAALILLAAVVINIHLANINHKNNEKWMEMFGSYDFISQDGEGVNNINSGTQGDVTNFPEE